MLYEKDVIQILIEAGDKGLSISKIAHHVFNTRNNLFGSINYNTVYNLIYRYIKQNLKRSDSPIVNASEHGKYTINHNQNALQQFIVWLDEEDTNTRDEDKDKIQIDQSLSLF